MYPYKLIYYLIIESSHGPWTGGGGGGKFPKIIYVPADFWNSNFLYYQSWHNFPHMNTWKTLYTY